tara:strand:+ start:1242 stop:1565 length:324 start_codon:yes stop_codon:yes gene_type:complete
MANTYSWKINQLDTKIKHDKKSNVVYNVHWSYIAQDDSETPYIASSYGSYPVEYDKSNFITFSKLKKEDVVQWLEKGLDVDSMKKDLDNQIVLQKNPVENNINPNWD